MGGLRVWGKVANAAKQVHGRCSMETGAGSPRESPTGRLQVSSGGFSWGWKLGKSEWGI